MSDFGSYEILRKAVDAIKNEPLPYAEPTDIYNFAENSNIIRSLKYPNGEIYGYSTSGTGTTQLVPEISTSSISTSTNTSLSVTSDGTGFEGLTEINLPGYYGHGVLGSLSILNDISAVASSIGINAEELAAGHDPLWLQSLADSNPDLYTFLNSSTIDYLEGVPMLHDVVNGISYINEDGISLALEILKAQGAQSSKTYQEYVAYNVTKVIINAEEYTEFSSDTPFNIVIIASLEGRAQAFLVSNTPQSIHFKTYERGGTIYEGNVYTDTSHVFGGYTMYSKAVSLADINRNAISLPLVEHNTQLNRINDKMVYASLHGAYSYPEGYSDKPDANTIDLSKYKGLSAKDKIAMLGHDYPAWIANKLTTRIKAQDGTIKLKDWLPVQLPWQFNNNNPDDTYNTDGTQTDDGSYPDEAIEKTVNALTVLNSINNYNNYGHDPNPTTAPTPDNIDRRPPKDNTPPISQGALVGAGAVTFDDVPSIGAKVYIPSREKLNELMSFLWSGLFDLDTFKKLFQDPMEAIVGLQQVYFSPRIDGHDEIILGNVRTGVDDTPYTSKRFYRLDCGSVSLPEYFGNVFDYQTDLKLYLPFVGIVSVSTDECMRASSISVFYDLDLLSGAGNAKVVVNRDGNQVMIGTFGCQTASQYPISGSNHMASVNTILGLSAGAIGAAAGGVGGMMAGSALAKGASRLVGSAGGMQSHIQQSGGYMANGGLIHKTPYLIIERPIPNMPVNYNEFDGYPYYKSTILGNCVGMTKCGEVHLDVSGISSLEKDMIISELQKGVIL